MSVALVNIENKVTRKVAVRLSEDNLAEVRDWIQGQLGEGQGTVYVASGDDKGLLIPTLEGIHTCPVGHWVIRGLKGEFYGCEDEIFRASYNVLGPA